MAVQPGGGTHLAEGFQAALDLLGPSGRAAGGSKGAAATKRKAAKGKAKPVPLPPSSGIAVKAEGGESDTDDEGGRSRGRATGGVFVTDMESQQSDEGKVQAKAKAAAEKDGVFTPILGIGVDLSVGAVQALSMTPGGRYASVSSNAEFSTVAGAASNLVHDAVPVAFDITATIGDAGGGGGGGDARFAKVRFQQGCGHPEAAALKPVMSRLQFTTAAG